MSEPYRPKLRPSTAPSWLSELKTRLEAEKAAEEVSRKAKAAEVNQEQRKRRRQKKKAAARVKFIEWFQNDL